VAGGPLRAQEATVAGRVERARDGRASPVTGATVVLHRVSAVAQGPIDTTRSDAAGRFAFRYAADTGAVYLVSARYAGIEYFAAPLPGRPGARDTGLVLAVHDTSSAVPVALAARSLVVTRPEGEGGRTVLDVFVLVNGSDLTRVAADTAVPVWAAPLPARITEPEVGPGDFTTSSVRLRDGAVALVASVAPGVRQLLLEYHLAAGQRELLVPFATPVDSVSLLLEDARATVDDPGFARGDTATIEGRQYRHWSGRIRSPGTLRVVLSPPRTDRLPLLALVALVALGFGAALWRFRARRAPAPAPAPAAPPPDANAILEELAALDARFAGREAELPPAEWQAYQRDRARLKAALEAQLAARAPRA